MGGRGGGAFPPLCSGHFLASAAPAPDSCCTCLGLRSRLLASGPCNGSSSCWMSLVINCHLSVSCSPAGMLIQLLLTWGGGFCVLVWLLSLFILTMVHPLYEIPCIWNTRCFVFPAGPGPSV